MHDYASSVHKTICLDSSENWYMPIKEYYLKLQFKVQLNFQVTQITPNKSIEWSNAGVEPSNPRTRPPASTVKGAVSKEPPARKIRGEILSGKFLDFRVKCDLISVWQNY